MSQIVGSIAYGVTKPVPPITPAERQAKLRERKKEEKQALRDALKQIIYAKTIDEAREIAVKALVDD